MPDDERVNIERSLARIEEHLKTQDHATADVSAKVTHVVTRLDRIDAASGLAGQVRSHDETLARHARFLWMIMGVLATSISGLVVSYLVTKFSLKP